MRTPVALALAACTLAASLATSVSAREVAYDFVVCNHTRHTPLDAGPEGVAFGVEQWGIVASSTTPEFENATTHCVGTMRVVGGKPSGKGMCKWFSAAGDTALGEFEVPPSGENRWTWLWGTGAWKGVTGTNSQFKSLGSGKPAAPGTSQSCRRDWGSYTLP